ncbi:hypothetical protein RYX36_016353 [Vicia faba]
MRNSGGGPIRTGPMGRMGSYAGFPGGPMPPFSGVGSHGLVPYANHSFYGRGMPMHGMGMIPPSGMGGPSIGRWNGDEYGGGKVAESSYGEEVVSDYQYDEVDRDRGDSEKGLYSTFSCIY